MLPKRRFKEGVAELAVVIVSMEGVEDVKDAIISLWGLMSEVGGKMDRANSRDRKRQLAVSCVTNLMGRRRVAR